ncbi:hypothetical protein, partial [Salmonella enterica]|uniref:hypothetical protein n=2 Tax=Salmonella enterica TaxID=28901 RepID=UPI000AE11FD6
LRYTLSQFNASGGVLARFWHPLTNLTPYLHSDTRNAPVFLTCIWHGVEGVGRSPDQMAIVIASRVTVLQLHILSRKFPPFLGFLSVADRTTNETK